MSRLTIQSALCVIVTLAVSVLLLSPQIACSASNLGKSGSSSGGLLLKLAPGDMLRYRDSANLKLGRGGKEFPDGVSFHSETKFVVLDENPEGVFTVYGQTRVTPPGGVERWTIFTYLTDLHGNVVSFPARNVVMNTFCGQGVDLSWGALVPFSLPSSSMELANGWQVQMTSSPNPIWWVPGSAYVENRAKEGPVRMRALSNRADSEARHKVSMEMVLSFDSTLGLPLGWHGTAKAQWIDTMKPTSVSCDTSYVGRSRLTEKDMSVLRRVSLSLLTIQEGIDKEEMDLVLSEAGNLQKACGETLWTRGLKAFTEYASKNKPCGANTQSTGAIK